MQRRSFLNRTLRAVAAAAVPWWAALDACSKSVGEEPPGAPTAAGSHTKWPRSGWGDVPIGGGGFVTQAAVDMNTGILWCGTDVQNSYLRRPDDAKWATVFRADTMRPEDMVRNRQKIDGKSITDGLGSNMGAFAGTEGTRAYSAINSEVFTLDLDPTIPLAEPGGIKATKWNLAAKWMRTNQGWDRMWGPGLSGHPTDKNLCLLGTENDGAYYTLNGGKIVERISVPECTGGIGPAAGRERILVWQAAEHSFVFIQGVGLHRSLTGPTGQFDLLAGGPIHATSLYGEADGTLWLTGDPRIPNADSSKVSSPAETSPDAGVWRLNKGSGSFAFMGNPLKQWAGYGPLHVAVDPHDRNNVIAFKDQQGAISTDRGQTWVVTGNNQCKMVAGGEAAWRLGSMLVGDVKFTPKRGQVFWGEGFGCLLTEDFLAGIKNRPLGDKYWALEAKDYSKGIEEFIVNNILINPRTGKVWLNCWDRHVVDIISLTEYINLPKQPTGIRLSLALQMDVAVDTDFYVVGGGSGTPSHSWSQGGALFTPFGKIFPPRPGTTQMGGSAGAVAVGKKTDIVIVQSNNWPAVETQGRFNPATGIPDRAEDWSVIELDGSTNYHTVNAFYVTRKSVAADKTRPGVMAMVVSNMDPRLRSSTNNPLGGLWVRPGTTAPWQQTVKGLIGGKGERAQFWQCQLSYVPGRSGELLYTGYIGQAACPLVHLKDDGRSEELVPNIKDVVAFGFGHNQHEIYPAVLFRGKFLETEGYWLTLDWFKTVRAISDLFPNEYWSAGTSSIAGDMSPDGFGKWIISVGGKGAVFTRLA